VEGLPAVRAAAPGGQARGHVLELSAAWVVASCGQERSDEGSLLVRARQGKRDQGAELLAREALSMRRGRTAGASVRFGGGTLDLGASSRGNLWDIWQRFGGPSEVAAGGLALIGAGAAADTADDTTITTGCCICLWPVGSCPLPPPPRSKVDTSTSSASTHRLAARSPTSRRSLHV
jgi:hypothetical protein